MVYRAWLGAAILLAGCAPRVILSNEDGSGTSDETDTAASSDGGDSSSPVTTQPPTTTIGPMSTSGPVTDTFGSSGFFGSTGFFGSSGSGGFDQLCWSVQPLFEAPEESRLFVRDQNGDGLSELWLAFFEGGGPGGGSELFAFDSLGVANPAGFFPGFITGLANLNGDDVLDAVGFSFGGGGPPSLGYIEGAPNFIDGPVVPTPFGFEDGFEAFVDVNGDGIDDFVRNLGNVLELQVGDGVGGFQPLSGIPSTLVGDVTARPVRGNEQLFAVSQSSFFDELNTCAFHPFELLTFDGAGFISTIPSGESVSFAPNELLGAEHYGSFTNAYVRACSANEVTVQVQRFEGNTVNEVDNYDPSSFAAFGDFDGNGQDDIGLGGLTLDTIRIYNGSAAGTFTEGLFTEVLFGEPVPNRVYIVDMDGDGRDEIILGTRDGGSEIVYQRLDLDPC